MPTEFFDGLLLHSEFLWPYKDQDSFGAKVVRTRIESISDEIVQESFEALNRYLCDALKDDISSCRLLFEPSQYKPYCYILISRNSNLVPGEVWAKMDGPTAPGLGLGLGYPFSVIIDSHSNHLSGHNPEFETYDEHGEKFDSATLTFPDGVDVDADDFFDELIIGYEDVFVMFGHRYDAASGAWDNSVAIWVCFEDPIRRYFHTSKSERRQVSYKGIPVHYFSANSSCLSNKTHKKLKFEEIEATTAGQLFKWQRSCGMATYKQYSCGMGFAVEWENGDWYSGTIGPNLKSFPSNFERELKIKPDNYYLVSRHVVVDGAFSYNDARNCCIYDLNMNPIGRLFAVHKFLDVAIIELYCKHTPDVKINVANDRLEVRDFIPFAAHQSSDQRHISLGDLTSLNIFKSGQTTGVTKGHIYSWGIHVGTRYKPDEEVYSAHIDKQMALLGPPTINKQFYLFGKKKNRANFSEDGDSGSPVVAIQNDSAKFIGIVEAGIYPSNLRLSVILPIRRCLLDLKYYDRVKAVQYKVPFFSYQLSEKVEYGKIRILLGEEIDGKFKRACVAEFIAMFFFVTMCCGCAMTTLAIPNPNLMMVSELIFYFFCDAFLAI